MAKAFLIITTEPSATEAIATRLCTMRGIVAYEVLGPFDFIVAL